MYIWVRVIRILVTLIIFVIAQAFVAACINSFFELIPVKIDDLFDIKTYRFFQEYKTNRKMARMLAAEDDAAALTTSTHISPPTTTTTAPSTHT